MLRDVNRPLAAIDSPDRSAPVEGGAPEWLESMRGAGLQVFRNEGIPHAKVEAWKYTNLNQLAKLDFDTPASAPTIETLPADRLAEIKDAHRLVFVNGILEPGLSDLGGSIEGVELENLARAAAGTVSPRLRRTVAEHLGRLLELEHMPFSGLNAALWEDGVVLRIDNDTALDKPLHVISIGAASEKPAMFHPRNLIVLGRGSKAVVVESHVSLDGAPILANPVSEVALGEGAVLGHYKLIDEAPQSFHVSASGLHLAAGAHYDGFVLTIGGRIVRNEVRAHLLGTGATCQMNGAYVADGESHVDNTTLLDHVGTEAISRQVFKGVLDDTASGVFQGKVLVRKHAQKTDGHQLHKALLLSPGAEVDAKPELEIYADDVKCSHGATAGQLDADAIFYLRARGIPAPLARLLVIRAFLSEAVERIESPDVRDAFAALTERRLAAVGSTDAAEERK